MPGHLTRAGEVLHPAALPADIGRRAVPPADTAGMPALLLPVDACPRAACPLLAAAVDMHTVAGMPALLQVAGVTAQADGVPVARPVVDTGLPAALPVGGTTNWNSVWVTIIVPIDQVIDEANTPPRGYRLVFFH